MAWKDFNRKGVGRIVNSGGKTSTFAQNQFEMQLKEFTDQYLPEQQVLFVKKISMELLKKLVDKSPVRTGRFRANWFPSVGAPSGETTEETDKDGDLSLRRLEDALQGLTTGEKVYISNNLDYALMLEYGWSGQAPAGMVAISINEIEAWLQGVKKTAIESL